MLFNADVALMSSKFGCLHFYLVEPLDGRFNGVKNNEHMCVYIQLCTHIYNYIYLYVIQKHLHECHLET